MPIAAPLSVVSTGSRNAPGRTPAAMSSDGPLWASTLSEEGAWIVHADGQEEVVIAEHPLEDIVLAAKGAIVFAAARDGELWIHDLETGKQRPTREECRPPRRDDGGGSRELLAARDGSRVATTSDGILCVWDAASGSILVRREEPDGVWRLSPDLRLGVHSPRDRDDSDRLFELDRGTATSLPPEAYAIAVTAKGLVVYAHDALLWAWDAKTNERWAVSLAASVLRFATVSLEDDELVLHSARGGLRFVSLERPSAIGPAEAAALTEVVTLSPTKLP